MHALEIQKIQTEFSDQFYIETVELLSAKVDKCFYFVLIMFNVTIIAK